MHLPAIQFEHPEISSIWDGPQAAPTRQKFLQSICDKDIILAAMHVIGVGYVKTNQNGGYILEEINQ